MISINNVIIVEPYTSKRKIEATVNKGLATVKQRVTVVGLKVLADARISDTQTIKKGSVVFLNEKYLYENQNVLTPMECDAIEGSFITLSIGYILMVKEA
jgi:hypothetical protein